MTDITGRDHLIIGQALFRAVRAMRADRYPEWSNIHDMERILNERYHQLSEHFEEIELLRQAKQRGMVLPLGPIDFDKVRLFIKENTPITDRVVTLDKSKES